MEIKDEGIIISQKKYGENGLIINIFSKNNGVIKGFKRFNKKSSRILLFDYVFFNWRSKVDDALGYFNFEIVNTFFSSKQSYTNNLIKTSAIELCLKLIPLREKNFVIFYDLINLIRLNDKDLSDNYIISEYLKWEIKLLNNLGYGIDLTRCTVSGEVKNLAYVSPKTGKAVTEKIGRPWKNKLLVLPIFFLNEKKEVASIDLINGFKITNFFFKKIIKNVFQNKKIKFLYREQLFLKVINFD